MGQHIAERINYEDLARKVPKRSFHAVSFNTSLPVELGPKQYYMEMRRPFKLRL
jgi:hypothetical protein